jgi:hypothetical protein
MWQAPDAPRLPLHRVSGMASRAHPVRPVNPVLIEHARERARIADQITAFAGSMCFVYLHLQEEDGQNKELLVLSRQILELTRELHAYTEERKAGGGS